MIQRHDQTRELDTFAKHQPLVQPSSAKTHPSVFIGGEKIVFSYPIRIPNGISQCPWEMAQGIGMLGSARTFFLQRIRLDDVHKLLTPKYGQRFFRNLPVSWKPAESRTIRSRCPHRFMTCHQAPGYSIRNGRAIRSNGWNKPLKIKIVEMTVGDPCQSLLGTDPFGVHSFAHRRMGVPCQGTNQFAFTSLQNPTTGFRGMDDIFRKKDP